MAFAVFLAALGALAVAGIVGAIRAVYRDGYGRRPDRAHGDDADQP